MYNSKLKDKNKLRRISQWNKSVVKDEKLRRDGP
jgi:hypothetical protein